MTESHFSYVHHTSHPVKYIVHYESFIMYFYITIMQYTELLCKQLK